MNINTYKQKILIVDDSEMNRAILSDMLEDEYTILEAEDGMEAILTLQKHSAEISLVLLDYVMPKMDGFEVLTIMNQNQWIDNIPVIMISSENSPSYIENAYRLGVTDFIVRPFDTLVVHRRVINTILLYAKQKKLIDLVAEQIREKEKQSSLMINILSHIVEFRNGESGPHVLHIQSLTEMFLKCLIHKTDRYNLSPSDISLISMASALHDIGKIAIPHEILNKPGRLTPEEFEIMKTHSQVGADMLSDLPAYTEEKLVKTAKEICRWHHERYDGRGYPDGLKGEEIPISAQIVALADVYDALTSERIYKKAIPSDTAIQMILDGACGTFNPLLLECLSEMRNSLEEELRAKDMADTSQNRTKSVVEELLRHKELTASARTLQLLEHERMKSSFFASMSEEIQFEFTTTPPMITFSGFGASRIGLDEIIMDPIHNEKLLACLGKEELVRIDIALRSTTPDKPIIHREVALNLNGQTHYFRIIARATWSSEEQPQYLGALGKAVDISNEREKLEHLEHIASHDGLTGLLNHISAKERIKELLSENCNNPYALVIVDLDYFKSANDTYGHKFGDQVLQYFARKLSQSIRGNDIAARIGGDEFLIFLTCYKGDIHSITDRIFHALKGSYENFPITVSMGVAEVSGTDKQYDTLFHRADQALFAAKRRGRGQYCFYDDSLKDMFSALSPIDCSEENGKE